MARQESDREDLMREASALVRRVELLVPGEPAAVIAGFRATGFLAVYFGADPVYQFDDQRRLRRAFVNGCLFRTQGETLARLTRVRTETATELHRHDLPPSERDAFIAAMRERLRALHDSLARGLVRVVNQLPAGDDILTDLTARLQQTLDNKEPLAPPICTTR